MNSRTIVCLVALVAFSAAMKNVRAFDRRPNILVILTDDQGYGDLGCYGSPDIETPNLDQLCADGMKFESFYVHNRCSPTRAALMTGCLAQRVGMGKVIYRKDRAGINAAEVTIAERLQEAGYATGIVGKWHLGEYDQFNPVRHGFDTFFGFMQCDDSGTTAIYDGLEIKEKINSKTDGRHSLKLVDAATDFIVRNRRRPFFLYYASPLPHTKWKPHPGFVGKSRQGTYGDVVQEIDWQVGQLLSVLQECEIEDDTLVVFASDNGPQLNVDGHGSAGILRDGKWTDFEGGIRVPCIMRWPGRILPGTSNRKIVGIVDLYPTFCEIAQIDVPKDRVIDGKSILHYLLFPRPREIVRDSYLVPGAYIRYGDWKLLVKAQKPGGGKSNLIGKTDRVPADAGSLFNLAEDPAEEHNIAAFHPEIVHELERRMDLAQLELARNSRPIGGLDEGAPPEED